MTMGGDQIGSYNPNPLEGVCDVGVYLEASPPEEDDWVIEPYGRLFLKYAFGPMKGGGFRWDYTYDKDMRGATPSEWVLYVYDMNRFAFPLEPEIGFHLRLSDAFVLSPGISYERVTWTYFKGIEAYGEPDYQKLGTSRNDVFNVRLGVDVLDAGSFRLRVSGVWVAGDEQGYGGNLSFDLDL
jgi:hypothetical protein